MPDLRTTDGVTLHWEASGSPAAPPLLLLHGLGSDAQAFDPLAAAIGDRVHLVRLDLRGHGRSEPLADPARYGWFGRAAADVVELLDELGWEHPTIAGGSLGAAVTTATVLTAPDRVGAAGFLSPALGAGPGFANPVALGFMQGVQALGLLGLFEQLVPGMPDLSPAVISEVRANYGRQDDAAMRACCTALVAAVLLDDLDELRSITQPALVVAGRGDPLHPFEMGEAYASRLPAGRLVEVTPDADPALLAELLVELAVGPAG